MRKFQEQYSEVVRNQASVTLKITKCTTIGPPRIGKTCLKNLLIGQEWDVEAGTASTDVMEAPEWVECYSLEEGGAEKPWKLLSTEQQQGELIRAVNSLTISNTQMTISPSDAMPSATPMNVPATTTLRDAQPTTKPSDGPPTTKPSDAPPTTKPSDGPPTTKPSDGPPTTKPSDAPPTTKPSDAPPTTKTSDAPPTTKPSDAPPTTKTSDAPPTTEFVDASPTATSSDVQQPTRPTSKPPPPAKPAQKPATVLQALEALAGACSSKALQDFLKDKQGKVLGETRLVHFIDTGGQAIYHDVHPVLITSPSVYLVVFSLSELCKKSPEERIAYFRSGLIQRPLRSIYTFGTRAPRKEDYVVLRSEAPKILVVGTHLDQVPLEDSGMERFLDDISRMIEKEISNKPYRQFVQYDTKGRSFWAVDNTLAGKEQSEGVKKYNTDLRLMVQEGSTEMSVKVPLPWMLMKLVMDGQGVRYCKYSQLLEEARSRGYVREDSPDADLDAMLWLFHILGLIYHKVPGECKKEDSLVFIDPDCLYSATSDFLIAAKEEIEYSREAQHQTQAASRKKTEDNQGGSEGVQHQTQAASTEETENNQGDREEVQHQTQAASTEETEDKQRSSEEVQQQTQAASTEETEDNQGDSEEGQHQTQAASTEETEDNQGGSEEGQHQTQAASTEETEDKQRSSEEGQQQTQAASTEETEDNQRASEEVQQQTQAASTEETEDNQGDSEEGQQQTQAASTEETEDKQRSSEEGQHQTQAASTEETEDNQGDSEEGQQQTQAASTEETEDNQGDSEEGQQQTQAASTEETEDKQRSSEEGQHQTQAASTEGTEDNQVDSEEGQQQTQAASTEETEDKQRSSEEVQQQTQAASTEETEDNQGDSEEGQQQTQAASTEETEDNQGDSEEGQQQTQAASTEETEDKQRSSEEVQQQTQAASTEEIEDNQGDSEEGQQQTQAASTEETEDKQRSSEEGQHQTQAASTEETEDNQGDSEESQHQTQAASTEETEDNQGDSEEGQHQTQAVSSEEMFCDKEMAGERGRQQKQEANGIVQKRRVIERIQCNSESIKSAIEAELHTAEQAIKQEATEDVLTSLQDQLKKIEQQYKLPPRDGQDDAASVKAKQQLYIRRLVKSLASSVKAVLGDAGGKGDVQRVRREVGEAVKSIRKHYQGRSIVSQDMDQVLSILSDLRIVAKLSGSDRYVVPAALPEVSHSLNISGSADSILVTVVSQTIKQVCFLPSGLFCCLISELVAKLGWTVEPLGRTHVAFTHEDLAGVVHVVEHESYIEIKLESPAPLEELPKTCQNVRTKIHKHIVDVYKTLYSDPTAGSAFEESLVWGFRCEEHPGDDTHIAAFRKIADDEYWTECLLEPLNVLDIEPEQLVWFS